MATTPTPSPTGSTSTKPAVSRGQLGIAAYGTLIVGLLLFAGGAWEVLQRETGTRTQAEITECEDSGYGRYQQTFCSGTWEIGGSLLEGGHIGVGDVDGADRGDIGKTIPITLHGDKAYARSLGLPLFICGLGVVIVAGGIWFFRQLRAAPT